MTTYDVIDAIRDSKEIDRQVVFRDVATGISYAITGVSEVHGKDSGIDGTRLVFEGQVIIDDAYLTYKSIMENCDKLFNSNFPEILA